MADSKELKPVSYRLDDETKEKFKEISADIGGNQQETMSTLINAYYLQSQQNNLGEFKANIDQFQAYITSVVTMYTQSLQANHDMRDSVMQEFNATIQDLQEKLTVAKQLKEDATIKAKSHADENARLNSVIESLNTEYNSKMDDMQSMLADKDNLNKALTDSCNDLKSKVESMREDVEQLTVIQTELEQLKLEHDALTKEKSDIEKQLEQENTIHNKAIADLQQHEKDLLERQKEQSQIALDKAVLEVERRYQEQIEKLKADKQLEVDKYQQKYFDLLEQLKNSNVAAVDEEK